MATPVGNQAIIREALDYWLSTLVTEPPSRVAWPNLTFKPSMNEVYLSPSYLPNRTDWGGVTTAFRRHRGIYQVSVRGPVDVGPIPLAEIADKVIELFTAQNIVRNGITVRIGSFDGTEGVPYQSPELIAGGWRVIPVTIPWWADTVTPAAEDDAGEVWGIIGANGPFIGAGAPAAISTGTMHTQRLLSNNLTGKTVTALKLLQSNILSSGGSEAPNSNDIQVKNVIEGQGTVSDQTQPRTAVTYDGVTLATVPAGELIKSDRVDLTPNNTFYVRDGVTVPGTSQIYQRGKAIKGGTSGYGINNGEGGSSSDTVASGTTSATTATRHRPALVIGLLQDNSLPKSLAIWMDSIGVATDDGGYGLVDGGYPVRACDLASVPYVNLSISARKQQDIASVSGWAVSWALSRYATHIYDAHGRNDLIAGRTAAQIKADILSFARLVMSRSQTYIRGTILPAPTSSNGWFNTASQTKETTEAVRVEVNQWIRDTSENGFVAQANAQVLAAPSAKVFDACATVECDISGALTEDGGYILGSNTAKEVTGTATGATSSTIVDSGKSLTPNQFKGHSLYIASGAGAGQVRSIAFHDATTLTVNYAFSPAPTAGSTYEVFEGYGMATAVHPLSKLFSVVGSDMQSKLPTLIA